MRSAVALPMPGSASSCAEVAVFRLMVVAADAGAGLLTAWAPRSTMAIPRASRTTASIRIMGCLQAAPGRRATGAREHADDSIGEWKRGDLPHRSLRLSAAAE